MTACRSVGATSCRGLTCTTRTNSIGCVSASSWPGSSCNGASSAAASAGCWRASARMSAGWPPSAFRHLPLQARRLRHRRGMGCGLAGALTANYLRFVTPDLMAWQKSGDLMVMVILGGVGTLLGPVVGAVALTGLEYVLGGITENWQFFLGPILLGRGALRARRHHGAARPAPWLSPSSQGARAGQALRRAHRHRPFFARRPAGRAACADRPQRRRQDHADRPVDRRNPARCRPGRSSWART